MAPRKYEMKKREEAVEETRRRIIDATYELHSQKGVVATSIQDIAERADVSVRTVYNHYPTIEDLVAGCGEKVLAVLAPPTPETFAGIDTLQGRMRRLVEALFAMYERGPAMIEVARCEQSEVEPLRAFAAHMDETHLELVAAALRPLRNSVRTARAVAGLTDFYTWQALTKQGLTTRQTADVIYRSLVGLVTPAWGQKG